MHTHPIRFIRRGELVTLDNVAPSRTLLDVLREGLASTGTKEGCGEGDCGACAVVVGEAEGDRLIYRAVNSCIKLAHSIDGTVLWTVEDLAAADGTLHPAQQAMVQCKSGFPLLIRFFVRVAQSEQMLKRLKEQRAKLILFTR